MNDNKYSIKTLEEYNKKIIIQQGTVNREVLALMNCIETLEDIIKSLSNIYIQKLKTPRN